MLDLDTETYNVTTVGRRLFEHIVTLIRILYEQSVVLRTIDSRLSAQFSYCHQNKGDRSSNREAPSIRENEIALEMNSLKDSLPAV